MSAPLKDLLDALNASVELDSYDELKLAVQQIITAQSLSPSERDTIRGCYEHGPLDDGDIPCKTARNRMLDLGLVTKAVVKGEDGYNACTHQGAWIYRLIKAGA